MDLEDIYILSLNRTVHEDPLSNYRGHDANTVARAKLSRVQKAESSPHQTSHKITVMKCIFRAIRSESSKKLWQFEQYFSH